MMPPLFVLLWSTGFIGAKLGLPYAPPLTFLAVRFALTSAILLALVPLLGARLPGRAELLHLAVAGSLVHGLYLGGVYVAIGQGVEAGTSALIVCLQPLLVAALVGPLLGEKVTRAQWLGLLLGLAGCALVVAHKLGPGSGGMAGLLLCLLALAAITTGTLYQKRFCQGMSLVSGSAVQYGAATLLTGAGALLLEGGPMVWSTQLVLTLAWLVLVVSLGAMTLLYRLIRQGAAAKVSSLFFLVPPTTALMAYLLFGERLGPIELAGMAIAALGVALVNRPRRAGAAAAG